LGNVGVFLALQGASQNKVISVNSSNNLVSVPDRLVALVGVDDLCVVQTEDALLIIRRDDVESVKKIVERLKVDQLTDYL
jgi:mannose-1-phosphate guanylyltransferase